MAYRQEGQEVRWYIVGRIYGMYSRQMETETGVRYRQAEEGSRYEKAETWH